MLKAIAFGLGVGAALQAWRNFPADGPVTSASLAVVFCCGLVAAFLGGLWSGRGHRVSATATATATAVSAASAQNVVNLMFAPGAGAHSSGVSIPSDQAPWLLEGAERRQLTADELDGMEVSELLCDLEPQASE